LGKSQSYIGEPTTTVTEAAGRRHSEAIADGEINGYVMVELLLSTRFEITQAIVFKRILSDHLTVSQTDHLIAPTQ
jgi:ParB family chromosome partitioning protein